MDKHHRDNRIHIEIACVRLNASMALVHNGLTRFQGISYAGKPQVVSRYILSNLWVCVLSEVLFLIYGDSMQWLQ
jgi:hypothetical protein